MWRYGSSFLIMNAVNENCCAIYIITQPKHDSQLFTVFFVQSSLGKMILVIQCSSHPSA